MTALFRQDTRRGRLHMSKGRELELISFQGTDALDDLFAYEVEALASSTDVAPDQMLGSSASVEIDLGGSRRRWFSGIVAHARWLGFGPEGLRVGLTLRPWLWLADLRRNQRIFHNMSVVQILDQLFEPYSGLGKPAVRKVLTGSYEPIEYCVQYRESDLRFARRLMERFGISHFFEHAEDSHTLVLVDSVNGLARVEGGTRACRLRGGQTLEGVEELWTWERSDSVSTGAIRLTDYNFKTPAAGMEVDAAGDANHENGQFESFDYPGDFLDPSQGRAVAQLRVRQERTQSEQHVASGNCLSLGSGLTLEVVGDETPHTSGAAYVCLRATHALSVQSYSSGQGQAGPSFRGHYLLAPATAPLVPVRRTAAPVIAGPQTAQVVGSGRVDCDEHGRILVRFHWDLDGAQSMRCRVSQSWASQGWGGVVIPRVGMEVVVEFLEGDPDKPIVTGCVYNGRNKAPYSLPTHKTKTVLRSQSHGAEGFNEITFEDEAGKENLFLHAQRGLTARVIRDRLARIGSHDVLSVQGNRSQETGGSEKHEVGQSYGLIVGGTGDGAKSAADGVSGLAGKTAELVQTAMSIAGGAAGGFARSLAASALGFFNGDGLRGRGTVVADESPRADAGAKLVEAAGQMGAAVAPSVQPSEPGVMHLVVGAYKSESVGIASVEQVGKSRVAHVGGADLTHVGKFKKITVGDEFVVEVGSSRLVMRKDGTIILQGKQFNFTASGPVQINGAVIDLNKPGG